MRLSWRYNALHLGVAKVCGRGHPGTPLAALRPTEMAVHPCASPRGLPPASCKVATIAANLSATGGNGGRWTRATYTKRKRPCVGACFAPIRPCKERPKDKPGIIPSAHRFGIGGHLWPPFEHTSDSRGKQGFAPGSFACIRKHNADTRG